MVGAVRAAARYAPFVLLAPASALSALASLAACDTLQGAIQPPAIAKVAPEPLTPVAVPTLTMKGGKGAAEAAYPADFAATVKADGTILFPQHTAGRIKGASLLVDGEPVLTVNADGTLKGIAVKHHYAFTDDGALVADDGRGVRIGPDGAVRTVGGPWKYQSVFVWQTEGGEPWDKSAWRTLEMVALVVLENMLPTAIRPPGDAGAADKGLDIHIPPPSQWFK
jgi:hypothetical protein